MRRLSAILGVRKCDVGRQVLGAIVTVPHLSESLETLRISAARRILQISVTIEFTRGDLLYQHLVTRTPKSMLEEDQQIRFTQLWTNAQPSVGQYVASLIRDQWAVRDIVQNTSLALLQKFSAYDDSRPFLPWALGIAKFEVLGHQRDVARNRMVCDSEFLEQYTKAWANLAPRIGDEAAALQNCVGNLSGRPRAIIRLRYADGHASEAIAREMSLTASNVRKILERTREMLKQCVEKQLAALGGER